MTSLFLGHSLIITNESFFPKQDNNPPLQSRTGEQIDIHMNCFIHNIQFVTD